MSLRTLSDQVVLLVNGVIVPLLFGAALLLFLWGMFLYFFYDQETHREEARQFALWGIIGMVSLFSVWGVVNILLDTLGIRGT